MRLPRYERSRRPGSYRELQQLRKEGDLDTLRSYFEDPGASLRKRRRAVQFFCTCAPGGGGRGYGLTTTDPVIVPTCIKLLETETDPSIRRWATYGLRQSAGPKVEEGLLLGLNSEDIATRNHALIGLAETGSGKAVDAIAAQLSNPKTRKMALRALVNIGGPSALTALRVAAREEPEDAGDLREACAEIEAKTPQP